MVVELVLILPVFLLMIFSVMEFGHLAYRTILVNHVAYECARIGSMWAGAHVPAEAPRFDVGMAQSKVQEKIREMIPRAEVDVRLAPETHTDPQTGQDSRDLEVTVTHRVRLVFPMTPWAFRLARNCRGPSGECTVQARVRMPIDNPQRYGAPEDEMGKVKVQKPAGL